MGKQAVIIQHIAVETLGGNFETVLRDAGFELTTVPVFAGAPDCTDFDAPDLADVSLIISLGGPMSANDGYPALLQETAYLRAATTGSLGSSPPTPVIGICLGAQLLSRALGGAVAPTGGYQFGLRKIDITAEGRRDPVFSAISIPIVPRCTASNSPFHPVPSVWPRERCCGGMGVTFASRWHSGTGCPMGFSSSRN